MISVVRRWLSKRDEAKRINAALAAMSVKMFAEQRMPSLQDLTAIGAYASGSDGSEDAPVIIHADRSTIGKITQHAWLTERFGQLPDKWTLVAKIVYGRDDRRFESVRIRTKDDNEHVMHFDISGWFGMSR